MSLTVGEGVALSAGAIALAALIFGVLWIDYKKKKEEPDRKVDPLIKSVVFTAFILMLFVVLQLLGAIPKDIIQKWWFVFPIIFVAAFSLYWWTLRKRMPMSFRKQVLMADRDLNDVFDAETYRNQTNFLPIDDYKTTQEPGRPDVGNLILTRKTPWGKMQLWYQIDKLDGEILRVTPHPDTALKKQLEEKAFPKAADVIAKEFAGEPEEEEKKEERK